MKTLIKYVILAFIIYLAYSNWGGIKNWYESDGKELTKDVGDAAIKGGKEVIKKGIEFLKE